MLLFDAPALPDQWAVVRHGGRITDKSRVVYAGDEAKARARYDKLAKALRQGAVALYRPGWDLVVQVSGPALRTRW